MAAPKNTIWKLDPHTGAKHAILRRYLQAWTPILAQGGFPKIVYVDGFAGPGLYEGGEEGSPIIALKTAIDHAERIRGSIVFLFVEANTDRAEFLRRLVEELSPPPNFQVIIEGGKTFADAFVGFYRQLISRNGRLPPMFAFIDPFGWKGVSFSVIREILSQPSCEVLLTFMYEEINRFIGHPDQEANFDSFFGSSNWRSCINLTSANERNRCLHDLYFSQLKRSTQARYVRSFQMRNSSGAIDYYLFYATGNQLGLKKMKEAMWKVDPSGDFTFSDATDRNQMVLFGGEPNFNQLRKQLLDHFAGRETTIAEIEEYILSETAFRETHYKRQILKPLELAAPSSLSVLNAPPGRKPGTFGAPNLRLKFAASAN